MKSEVGTESRLVHTDGMGNALYVATKKMMKL